VGVKDRGKAALERPLKSPAYLSEAIIMRAFLGSLMSVLNGNPALLRRRKRPDPHRRLRLELLEDRNLLTVASLPATSLPGPQTPSVFQAHLSADNPLVVQVSGDSGAHFSDLSLSERGPNGAPAYLPDPRLAHTGAAALLLVADLNHDGRADLVVNWGNAAGVLLGQADGSLKLVWQASPDTASSGLSVFVGDYTDSGHEDLVTTDLGADGHALASSLFAGDGTGAFRTDAVASQAPTVPAPPTTPTDPAPAPADSASVPDGWGFAVPVSDFTPADAPARDTKSASTTDKASALNALVRLDADASLTPAGSSAGTPTSSADGKSLPAPRPARAPVAPKDDSSSNPSAANGDSDSDTLPAVDPVPADRSAATASVARHDLPGRAPEAGVVANFLGVAAGSPSELVLPVEHAEEAPAPSSGVRRAADTPTFLPTQFTPAPTVVLSAPGDDLSQTPLHPGFGDLGLFDPLLLARSGLELSARNGQNGTATSLPGSDRFSLTDLGRVMAGVLAVGSLKSLESGSAAPVAPGGPVPGDVSLLFADVAQRTTEALTKLVKNFYLLFLGRAALPGEENGWLQMLQSGQTEEQVLSAFLGTDEVYARVSGLGATGTPDERFIQGLFTLLFRRAASEAELGGWLAALSSQGRSGVASHLLHSAEYRSRQVEAYYRELVNQAPPAASVASWAGTPYDLRALRGIIFEAVQVAATAVSSPQS
jgi:FG-GAP-like repeat